MPSISRFWRREKQGFEIVSINWDAVAVRVQDTARAGTKSFSISLICSISVFFRV